MNDTEKIIYICYAKKGLLSMVDLCKRMYPSYMICSYYTAYDLYYHSPKIVNDYNNKSIDYWKEYVIDKCDELWLVDNNNYDKEKEYAKAHNVAIVRM